ncbi:hypothetical protein [Rummeliibacillus suwonensis]|uniref:hypothetical protein n=1 Tax=Rummeliibacillus suwonensis TaxID=1306154 RepID=UPI0011B55D19|nr:hypothetical protein [Rummeliibacillus suwonensis]
MHIGNLLLFLELAGDQNTVILNWDLLKQVAQFNDANQIEKKNDTNYQYDADGNLLQDEHFQYTYNEAQRLTSVQSTRRCVKHS